MYFFCVVALLFAVDRRWSKHACKLCRYSTCGIPYHEDKVSDKHHWEATIIEDVNKIYLNKFTTFKKLISFLFRMNYAIMLDGYSSITVLVFILVFQFSFSLHCYYLHIFTFSKLNSYYYLFSSFIFTF